jgi:hypothetical protein
MHTITEALARYDEWDKDRDELSEAEGSGHFPSSSSWEGSDDEGVELAHIFAGLLREPIKVWTCVVAQVAPVVTVHATEDECFEHLRNTYDPEGMSDDEPPVAIVSHLQSEGWVVDIDVHEVTRS